MRRKLLMLVSMFSLLSLQSLDVAASGVAVAADVGDLADQVKITVWSPVVLPAVKQMDLRAAKTGHAYRLFMSVPATPPPASGYPVIYVLDANAAFPVAALLARNIASRSAVTGQVAPLVVGIGYPGSDDFHVASRQRDYTILPGRVDSKASEGGAEYFLDFIEQELKPLVAANYPIDSQRQALFGHSFGGLLVLHTLFTRPHAFSTYLASSPSIWWQDKLVLSELTGNTLSHPTARLQLSVGSQEDQIKRGNYSAETLAMLAKRPMVSEARHLAARLRTESAWADRLAFYELEGEDHGGAWLPAMTRGMQFFMAQP